jgi:phosphoribosylglycinamide formyltransferase-1
MSAAAQRLVVLISGNGSNLQAILDACQNGSLPARVVGVIANQAGVLGLERAQRAGVPAEVLSKPRDMDRRDYDRLLAEKAAAYQPDWIILAGWMRLLSAAFLGRYPNRVVNIHPALPGQFPGVHAIERALAAFQQGEITQTGVMVHLVPDEGVDSGPVLGVAEVPIHTGEPLEILEECVHAAEHSLYVQTLRRLFCDPELLRKRE